MRELGELNAVLLAQKRLAVGALLDIVDLDRLVALGGHEQLARVVEVEGEHAGLGTAFLEVFAAEELANCQRPGWVETNSPPPGAWRR